MSDNPDGVWVSYSLDMGATDVRPHATELDALRVVNGQGYGSAIFVPFGSSVDDLLFARRKEAQR